ncbi:MAG: C39 family peptidase [Patescibacteria group bacterium]|jgi:hypothetical protein|nr:C39 family peptidase [Patescibacteria group bacterium]MDD4466812.1 C39 family peptidase [Patescibacteria group bacterium]
MKSLIIFIFFSALAFSPVLAVSDFVPFTPQAPSANWADPRQQDGCEEASALMAMAWVRGEESLSAQEAEAEILRIVDYTQKKYGESPDLYVADVVTQIFYDYFDYDNVCLLYEVTPIKLEKYLKAGHLILAPTNGRALANPYFNPPGPDNHMVVLKDYDSKTLEFITNDPGTKRGENYRYHRDLLFAAIRAYPSGNHLPHLPQDEKTVIVVKKK